MSTSATGGVLTTTLPDLVALRRFFQGLIAGITALPGNMVRPRFQKDPPPMPGIDVDWCAMDLANRRADASAYVKEDADGEGAQLVRHEIVDVICSFYGPNGSSYAEILRDGLQVSQNREPLFIAGMGLQRVGETTSVGEQHNQRWYERSDITLSISRETGKVYQILCFTGVIGAIITETMTLPFEVESP